MRLVFRSMDKDTAEEIANWKYDGIYSVYSMYGDAETVNELLNGEYFAGFDEQGRLVGFVCFGGSARVPGGIKCKAYKKHAIDIGIGMKPEFTGQGKGSDFFTAVLEFARSLYPGVPLRLTVASFNARAIKVYEKAGFKKDKVFQNTPYSDMEFITMILEE